MSSVKNSQDYSTINNDYHNAKYGSKLPPVNTSRVAETPSGKSNSGPMGGENTFITGGNGTGASMDKF